MFKEKHMIGIPSGFAGVVVGAERVFLWQQRPGAMAATHEDALRGEDAQLSTFNELTAFRGQYNKM